MVMTSTDRKGRAFLNPCCPNYPMKTFKLLLLVALGCMPIHGILAQKIALALHENQFHLIQSMDRDRFVVLTQSGETKLPVQQTRMVLSQATGYLPGYVSVEKESTASSDFDEENRNIADTFVFVHEATLTANRDLEKAFVCYQWSRADESTYIVALPLESMRKANSIHLRNRLYIPNRFKLVDPTIHYMAMGFEVGTSKDLEAEPPSPYAFACEQAGVSQLPDGNLKPLHMVPNPPIKDAEGNVRSGYVHLKISVDAEGYVTAIEPKKYSEWVFAKAVQMTAPLFLFQPKIENGKPVSTSVVVPFKF